MHSKTVEPTGLFLLSITSEYFKLDIDCWIECFVFDCSMILVLKVFLLGLILLMSFISLTSIRWAHSNHCVLHEAFNPDNLKASLDRLVVFMLSVMKIQLLAAFCTTQKNCSGYTNHFCFALSTYTFHLNLIFIWNLLIHLYLYHFLRFSCNRELKILYTFITVPTVLLRDFYVVPGIYMWFISYVGHFVRESNSSRINVYLAHNLNQLHMYHCR